MYVTPRQKRKYFWISIILIFGLPITTLAAVWAVRYYSLAGGSETPTNVILSNISSNSVSITWGTETDASGSVTVNNGKGDSAPFIDIRGTDRRKTHHVDIVDLEPAKDYTFSILSNDQHYSDENGKQFKFRTAPITSETPVPTPVYGSIDGTGKEDVLVYVAIDNLDNVYPASTATTSTGKWIVDMSALRDSTSRDLVQISPATKITVIARGGGVLGGTVSGTYSQLVDSEGQMKTPISISDTPTDSLLGYIPDIAFISKTETSNIPETPQEPEVPEEPETPEEPEIPINTDVSWESIKGTETTSQITSLTGEKSVEITNVSDTGFTVTWLTQTPVVGSVKYGTTAAELTETAADERDSVTSSGQYYSHSVSLSRLQPETKYYFEINSGDQIYTPTEGVYSQTTFKTLDNPPEFKTVSGKINSSNYYSDSIVIAQIEQNDSEGSSGTSTSVSSLTDGSGNWILTLGNARDNTGESYFQFGNDDKVNISVLSLAKIEDVRTPVATATDTGVTLGSLEEEREIVKIPALSKYYVYNTLTASETGGGGVDVSKVKYVPKTADSKSLLIMIVSGGSFLILGTLIFLYSQKRYKVARTIRKMASVI